MNNIYPCKQYYLLLLGPDWPTSVRRPVTPGSISNANHVIKPSLPRRPCTLILEVGFFRILGEINKSCKGNCIKKGEMNYDCTIYTTGADSDHATLKKTENKNIGSNFSTIYLYTHVDKKNKGKIINLSRREKSFLIKQRARLFLLFTVSVCRSVGR